MRADETTRVDDELTDRGWSCLDGFFDPSEVASIVTATERRQWPSISDDLVRWIMEPRWAAVATATVGPDVRFLREQVVTKAPESAATVPWHQDDAYARVDGMFVTCFVALDDITTDNGCLRLLSGGHHQGALPHRPSGYLIEIPGLATDDGDAAPQRSGDLLVFNSLVPHASGGNSTTGTRRAWMVQFCREDALDRTTGERITGCPQVAADGRWLDHPRH